MVNREVSASHTRTRGEQALEVGLVDKAAEYEVPGHWRG